GRKDPRVRKVNKDRRESPVRRVRKDPRDPRASLALWARKAHKGHRDRRESRVLRGHLGSWTSTLNRRATASLHKATGTRCTSRATRLTTWRSPPATTSTPTRRDNPQQRGKSSRLPTT